MDEIKMVSTVYDYMMMPEEGSAAWPIYLKGKALDEKIQREREQRRSMSAAWFRRYILGEWDL